MTVLAVSEGLSDLVDPDAPLERLAGGFAFTEGPAWHPDEQALYFSDVHADVRWSWADGRGAVRVADPSHKSNGSCFTPDRSHIVCEHVTSRLVAHPYGGGRPVVLASHYGGRQLNSPNDVCVRQDGMIFFSDPGFGRVEPAGPERSQELPFQGVYGLDPTTGALTLAHAGFAQPNGLCFSPDGNRLYVNDTPRAHIRVFDVGADGALVGGDVFAERIGSGAFEGGIVDGMKCDARGNVWVTGPEGIWVFSPDGVHLGILPVPEPNVGNLAWGGPRWDELFVCATSVLYRIRTRVPGHHLDFPPLGRRCR